MALKDWKKIGLGYYKGNEMIGIFNVLYPSTRKKMWQVRYNEDTSHNLAHGEILFEGNLKSEALAYAKKYMRTH